MLGLVPVMLFVLAAGMLMGAPTGDVPPAYAALCQSSHGCIRPYLHAVMNVQHVDTSTPARSVQPNTGESLSIAAYWNTPPPGPCDEVSETATADVDWNGSAFVLSNVNLPAHIAALYLCSGADSCSEEYTHSHNYKIIAEVTDPVSSGGKTYHLRQVVFATTAVDNGYLLDYSTCTTGTSVSPTSQTFSQTDAGTFECAGWPDCTASGPTLQLNIPVLFFAAYVGAEDPE